MGAVAALIGAGLAGVLLKKIAKKKAFITFSIIKLISISGFYVLALNVHKKQPVLFIYMVNAFEEFASAMLLVVMLTLMMQYCRKPYAATDFTFQVSILSCVSGGLYIMSGLFADLLGYTSYIQVILLFGLIHLLIIGYWAKK